MLTGIQIKNYRRFANFGLSGLSRISLLTGTNNCGKTTVLDAAEVLASGGTPRALFRAIGRRREYTLFEEREMLRSRQMQIGRLFHGFARGEGSEFQIESLGERRVTVRAKVEAWSGAAGNLDSPKWVRDSAERELRASVPGGGLTQVRFLVEPKGDAFVLTMDSAGEAAPRLAPLLRPSSSESPSVFLGTGGLSAMGLSTAWNRVVQTQEEDSVLELVRLVTPEVERIQATAGEAGRGVPSNLLVRLRSHSEDVPIGTFGDGFSHLLALGCALHQARDGLLLVDEIDTGLHHTVMKRMWLALFQTATRLNSQIIATTHSDDCINSLAWAVSERSEMNSEVCVHRMAADATESQRFDSENITVAVGGGIDLR